MVPRKATKTTLCVIRRFLGFYTKSHFFVGFFKNLKLMVAIFFGKSVGLEEPISMVFRGLLRFFEVFGPKPTNKKVEN